MSSFASIFPEDTYSILTDPANTQESQHKLAALCSKILRETDTQQPYLGAGAGAGSSATLPLREHPFLKDMSNSGLLEIWINVRKGLEAAEISPESIELREIFQRMDEQFYNYRENLGLEIIYPLLYADALISELADPKPGVAPLVKKIASECVTDSFEKAVFVHKHSLGLALDRENVFKSTIEITINQAASCKDLYLKIKNLNERYQALSPELAEQTRNLFFAEEDSLKNTFSRQVESYKSAVDFYLDFIGKEDKEMVNTHQYIFKEILRIFPSPNPFKVLTESAQIAHTSEEEITKKMTLLLKKFDTGSPTFQLQMKDYAQEFMEEFEDLVSPPQTGPYFDIYKALESYTDGKSESSGLNEESIISSESVDSPDYPTSSYGGAAEEKSSPPDLESTEPALAAPIQTQARHEHPLLKDAMKVKKPSAEWVEAGRAALAEDRTAAFLGKPLNQKPPSDAWVQAGRTLILGQGIYGPITSPSRGSDPSSAPSPP
jgi:hypothetical protein